MPSVIIPPTDVSPNTGTGSEVLSTSPTLVTPTIDTITAPASTNLTLNGGSSGASLVLGQGTNGTLTLTPSGTGKLVASNGTTAVPLFDITNTNTVPTKNGLRILGPNASSSSARQWAFLANSTAYGDLEFRRSTTSTADPTSGDYIFGASAGGNFLIGSTADGGQKLQVAGTSDFTGTITTTQAAAGSTPALSIVESGIRGWGFYPTGGKLSIRPTSLGTFSFNGNTQVELVNTTASSSTTTGALVVSGGVGVAGAMYVGSGINVGSGSGLNSTGWLLYQSGTQFYVRDTVNGAMAMRFDAGAAPAANVINALSVGGSLTVSGIVQIADGQAIRNSNTSTGSYYFDSPNIEFRNPALSYATSVKVAGTGNFLLGTTVDGGQRLQVAGTIRSTGNIESTTSTNGYLDLAVANTSAGTSAVSRVYAYNGAYSFALELPGQGFTTSGPRVPNRGYLYCDGAQGLTIHSINAPLRFWTGNPGTEALVIDTSQNATFAGTVKIGSGTSNSSYQNIYTNKAENTSGPFNITLPADCAGVVRLYSSQSGIGKSVWEIPFINSGGTVTVGTIGKTVQTAEPVTSATAGTGVVAIAVAAANTYCYWGINVVKP